MGTLSGTNILLGVTGGIAACKAVDLVRRLREQGAHVRVVMTSAACQFVTPLTFQAASGEKVYNDLFDLESRSAMGHIDLARWADVLLIAPATANFLARLAHGLADDLLSTLCLASTAPVWVAPAMNQYMWQHAATQSNLDALQQRGVRFLGPAEGAQACGDNGPGRLLEPETMVAILNADQGGSLLGVRVLITAGPTREPIDAVRFISNRSSGKMGYALAEAFLKLGADVRLISGPVALASPQGISTVAVETAGEMYDVVMSAVVDTDIFISAAAVADFRPNADPSHKKRSKSDMAMTIELSLNKDILAAVAASEQAPMTVGFAAQTHDMEARARGKLVEKNIDMIAGNCVGGTTGGFDSDENSLLVIWAGGEVLLPMMQKTVLAGKLAGIVGEQFLLKSRLPVSGRL